MSTGEAGTARSVATVVTIDCGSYSVAGRDVDALRQAAISLDAFLRAQFPDDTLYPITVSAFANQINREQLPEVRLDEAVVGTNVHQALMLAKEILEPHAGDVRQIYILSGGEMTAHSERSRSYFAYPPSPVTMRVTSQALLDCARAGISVTIFVINPTVFLNTALMLNLGDDFKISKNVVAVATTPDTVGQAVVNAYRELKHRLSWFQ